MKCEYCRESGYLSKCTNCGKKICASCQSQCVMCGDLICGECRFEFSHCGKKQCQQELVLRFYGSQQKLPSDWVDKEKWTE